MWTNSSSEADLYWIARVSACWVISFNTLYLCARIPGMFSYRRQRRFIWVKSLLWQLSASCTGIFLQHLLSFPITLWHWFHLHSYKLYLNLDVFLLRCLEAKVLLWSNHLTVRLKQVLDFHLNSTLYTRIERVVISGKGTGEWDLMLFYQRVSWNRPVGGRS